MSENIKKPNFFIIGAPKCGTTAMSEYLREHPDVFMPEKEMNFFSSDINRGLRVKYGDDMEKYLSNFEKISSKDVLVGEKSVLYLYSQQAVLNILKFNAEAKFIVMLRNPADLVPSLHAQFLKKMDEDVENTEKAWSLQEKRKEGVKIPEYCPDETLLQYGEVCKLGEQVERLFKNVSRKKVKVILFDDFKDNPKKVYEELLEFLELPYDGRTEFPVVNERQIIRSYRLKRYLKDPPRFLVSIANFIKKILRISQLNILSKLRGYENKLNVTQNKKPSLSKEFKQELVDYFNKDIDKLAELTGRDLSHWKNI